MLRPPLADSVPEAAPFNLSRWFAIVGLISISAISVLSAALMTSFLTERMLRQEGVLTMEFIQSVVLAEKPLLAYFSGEHPADANELEAALEHIALVPDVLRANVYNAERTVLWSSDKNLIGKNFKDNDELDETLAGELVIHGDTQDEGLHKAEHQDLDKRVNYFVEIYIPVRDAPQGKVVGAVELYKNPLALAEALRSGRLFTFAGAAVAGLFLYLALFGLSRRADAVIQTQQERLVQSETLAAVGEMGSAVAHGIRNPLSSIRSSAELALEADADTAREAAEDIIAESDRLEEWVRQLLSYARPVAGALEAVALGPLAVATLDHLAREMDKRNIVGRFTIADDLPQVKGDPLLLGQVLHSLLANAVEAIDHDGSIELAGYALPDQHRVELSIRDSGPGMSVEQLKRVFKPFYTTKTRGLGVGLPLAKRIIERFGGRIIIDSEPGQGTAVRLSLPFA